MAAGSGSIEVEGLAQVVSAAQTARKEWGSAVLKEIRRAINPIRNEARQKFNQLGGVGPRVASTVRVTVTAKGAGLSMGSSRTPYARGREFGAKRNQTRPFLRGGSEGRTVVVARIPYSSPAIFGPWQGNQFETGGRLDLKLPAGNAFYPAIGAGAEKVYDALEKVADRTLALFPGSTGGSSLSGRLDQFLSSGGIN